MYSYIAPIWYQMDFKMEPKWIPSFRNRTQMEPTWSPKSKIEAKWGQDGSQNFPNRCQNGAKRGLKWLKNEHPRAKEQKRGVPQLVVLHSRRKSGQHSPNLAPKLQPNSIKKTK